MESNTTSDEIDLGQLIQLIRGGFTSVFKGLLRTFLFIKRNVIVFVALIAIGVLIGIVLNNLSPERMKTEVIVKPNFDSKDYLYDIVDEINGKLIARDTAFFKQIDIDVNTLEKMRVEINPIESEVPPDDFEERLKYLQLLKDFPNTTFMGDILKTEILKNSVVNHKITFSFKNTGSGTGVPNARKLMDYINDNRYFSEIKEITKKNAERKIAENQGLIQQIDKLISGFTKTLDKDGASPLDRTVLLDNENGLNIPSLLSLKNTLIRENESKNLELSQQDQTIKIINFGKPQQIKKPIYGERIIKFPLVLIGLYLLVLLIIYLNKKARQLL